MKVALVGCGYFGSKIKRYIEENPFFILSRVCNSKTDLNTVWNDSEIKAVFVATPNATHFKIVKDALAAGKHVFCEKPLTLQYRQSRFLQNMANILGLKLHVEYTYTFSESVLKAKQWVTDNIIGKLQGMDLTVRHLGRFGCDNVCWLLGSHMLSVLDMFYPLQFANYERFDLVENETTIISVRSEDFNAAINLSLNCPMKETSIIWYGEKGTIIYRPQPYDPMALTLTTYEKPVWTVQEKIPQQTETFLQDEMNNLRLSVESFKNVLTETEAPNTERAVKITRILEKLENSGEDTNYYAEFQSTETVEACS